MASWNHRILAIVAVLGWPLLVWAQDQEEDPAEEPEVEATAGDVKVPEPLDIPPDLTPGPTCPPDCTEFQVVWITKVKPSYPPAAKRSGIEGEIAYVTVFDKTGKVESITYLEGKKIFEVDSVWAIEQWRAEPMMGADGEPTKFRVTIRMVYKLSG